MFTRTKHSILLRIFCESMIDSKVKFKSIKNPNKTTFAKKISSQQWVKFQYWKAEWNDKVLRHKCN